MVLGLSNDIKIKVGSEKDCTQTISVEWPLSKVKEKIEEAFAQVQAQAKVPGFRPGKAPIDLIRESFKDTAYARAEDNLIREGVAEAIKSKKLQTIQSPVVQLSNFAPDKSFQFEFRIEVAPDFKVSSYKGLKLIRKAKPVSDDEVQKALQNVADMNSRLIEAPEGPLSSTQFAVIDYEGFLDNQPIQGAKAENFLLDMSAPQTIAGLAEGLVGTKPGESREVSVKFPEDSPAKELAAKSAVFKVEVKAIKEKKVPVLDDEFAKDVGLESLVQLRQRIRESLEKERKTEERRDLETQIMDSLLQENKFSVPASMVDKQSDLLVARQKDRLGRQGVAKQDVEKFIAERLKTDIRQQAEKEVRLAYVLNAIAEAEKIEASDADVEARVKEILEETDPKQRHSVEKLLRSSYVERIKSELRESKLFDWLMSSAKIKDAAGG